MTVNCPHRTIDHRHRVIYAPMSGVGGIVYDKDAVYIDVNDGGNGGDNFLSKEEEVIVRF